MKVIKKSYKNISKNHEYMIVEGSGGIICPIRYDDDKKIFLEDIIKELDLPCLIVADAGLGTINSAVLTIEYMKSKKIKIKGIILNRFEEANVMHEDNKEMIEKITNIKTVGIIDSVNNMELKADNIQSLFE